MIMLNKIKSVFKKDKKDNSKKILLFIIISIFSIVIFIFMYIFYNNNYLPFFKKFDCPIWEIPKEWQLLDNWNIEILSCFNINNFSCNSSQTLEESCSKNFPRDFKKCSFNCIDKKSDSYTRHRWPINAAKPVIYLYPEQKQEVKVELEVEGKLIADYPRYDEEIKGWEVTAYPDSTIIEEKKEYSYLFWEAEFENNDWDLSKWFIVEWKDAREFLQEKLSYIWLTPKEYNEFIVYWYPKMMNNKYNLVYFAWLDYTSKAPLNITPEPDSVLRVFTVIKPLEEKIDIQEQELERFDRKWFSVVEWGGTILE